MDNISNRELIEQLELQVEGHLREAIRTFQNIDTELLLRPSASGGWSIAQCLEHLNLYGRYYLPAIRQRLVEGKPSEEPFRSTWLGRYFTRMMNPETGKRKITAFKDYRPVQQLDADRVVAEFISQQEEILSLLRRARHADLNKVRIPVSIMKFVKLKLGDVFQFIIAHNERHLRQALRNLSASVTSA